MTQKEIELDFGSFVLNAELFDTAIAKKFAGDLPYRVSLMQWGGELYGSIEKNLGEEKPVPTIPPGGIAYTNNGNYVCIFFGQTPAWAVEYIGQIPDEQWKQLIDQPGLDSVEIRFHYSP